MTIPVLSDFVNEPGATPAEIRRMLARVGGGPFVFAVIDGAHWPDAGPALRAVGFDGVSLFRGAGPDVEAAGPWLVPVGGRGEALAAFVGDRPALVVWVCAAAEAALRHHLRTINIALAPTLDAGGERRPRAVMFRHWDPRALSDVLPLLDEARFARLLGPAEEVAFVDPAPLGGLGPRRAERTPDLPTPPGGMLTLTAEQMDALGEAMRERSRRRIGLYLRATMPDRVGGWSDAEMAGFERESEMEGRGLGLRTERGLGYWSFVTLATAGAARRDPAVVSQIVGGTHAPDTNIERLVEAAGAVGRAEAAAEG